jgi:hypothetical protein
MAASEIGFLRKSPFFESLGRKEEEVLESPVIQKLGSISMNDKNFDEIEDVKIPLNEVQEAHPSNNTPTIMRVSS